MFEAEDIFFRIDRIQKAFSSLSLESESLSEIFFATKYFLTTMNGRLYQTSKDEDGHPRTKADGGPRRTEDQVFSPRAVRLKDGRGQRTLKFRPNRTEADQKFKRTVRLKDGSGRRTEFFSSKADQSGPKRTVRP